MGKLIDINIIALFVEGLISFFSPCVLPLIPMYFAYLSFDKKSNSGNKKQYTIFLKTILFVFGICSVFLLLGYSSRFLGNFLNKYQEILGLLSGCLLLFLALIQADIIQINALLKTYRLPFNLGKEFTYLRAYLFGIIFSFAWTPCIGIILSSVILLAANNPASAIIYLLIYAFGLGLPFIVIGLFGNSLLNFLKNKQKSLQYVLKCSAIILLIFGSKMIYENSKKIVDLKVSQHRQNVTKQANSNYLNTTYKDYLGNDIKLEDYKGEIIYLNFIATWCTYCKQEVSSFQAFLQKHNLRGFYVMSPTFNGKASQDYHSFVKKYKINIPLIIDSDDSLFKQFGIRGVPTKFVLDKNGEILGYVSGFMQEEQFEAIHKSVLNKLKENK